MKKRLWMVLLALLLLAGCGAKEEIQEMTEPPLVEVQVDYEEIVQELPYADTELVMQSMWLREDAKSCLLLEAAALFERQTGAVVTVRWRDENTTLESAEGIDIIQIPAAEFASMNAEYALDMTDMAAAAGYEAKSHETLRQQIVQQCGYLGAVAQIPYLGGIYYNADIFAQCGIETLPQDWDGFLALCHGLRQRGWQPLTLDQEDALAAMELHLRRSVGTDEVRRMMSKGHRWDTNMPAIDAMDQVKLFVQDGNMATGTPAETPVGQNKMASSNAAMMVGTNADCADVEEASLMDLNWGMFSYPGNHSSGTWMTADMLVIHRNTKHAQAAFDFLMLLATGEFDQLRADLSVGIPADPENESPVSGAMDAIRAAQPEPLGLMGKKQMTAAVRLWSAYYSQSGRYASLLEISK